MLFIAFRVSITWYIWTPAWGWGKSRPAPIVLLYWESFCNFSSYGGLFATLFSLWRAFSPCGVRSATIYSMVGAFLGLAPPPTKISWGAHAGILVFDYRLWIPVADWDLNLSR